MKKTTAYARKIKRTGGTHNGAEWMNTINYSRPYNEPPPPGFHDTKEAADKAANRTRLALQSLLECRAPDDPEHAHDVLAHALGVTTIRALQIQPVGNPMLPIIKAGNQAVERAIERYEKTGAWGLDGAGRVALIDAVNLYVDVLNMSSPAQMAKAADERMRILQGRPRNAT